ncbi:hypothetical protein [Anaerosporobacter sp.]
MSLIQAFTDVPMFLNYIRQNRVSIAIIGHLVSSMVIEDLIRADIPIIELVEESDNANGLDMIYKYQSAKNILSSVNKRLVAGRQNQIEKGKEELDHQLISILSPTGSISAAAMALAIAKYISKEEKTLYMNLNPFCCLEKILWVDHQKGFSDILYYYRQGEKSVLSTQQTYRMVGNIVYIPQVDHYSDIISMESKDMNQIMEEAKEEFGCTKMVICMKQITPVEEVVLNKSNAIYIEQVNVERYNTQNTILLDMLIAKGIIPNKEVKELPFIDTNQFSHKDFREIILEDNQLNMYIEPLINS